jgi:hypothetical protein
MRPKVKVKSSNDLPGKGWTMSESLSVGWWVPAGLLAMESRRPESVTVTFPKTVGACGYKIILSSGQEFDFTVC